MAEHVPVTSGFEPKYGGAYLICSCGVMFRREKHLVQSSLEGMSEIAGDFRRHARKMSDESQTEDVS